MCYNFNVIILRGEGSGKVSLTKGNLNRYLKEVMSEHHGHPGEEPPGRGTTNAGVWRWGCAWCGSRQSSQEATALIYVRDDGGWRWDGQWG